MTTALSLPESLAAALDALSVAVARAEMAAVKRLAGAGLSGDAEEELAAMQDDRARLAQELTAALEAGQALKAAHSEAETKLAAAAALIEQALAAAGGE